MTAVGNIACGRAGARGRCLPPALLQAATHEWVLLHTAGGVSQAPDPCPCRFSVFALCNHITMPQTACGNVHLAQLLQERRAVEEGSRRCATMRMGSARCTACNSIFPDSLVDWAGVYQASY